MKSSKFSDALKAFIIKQGEETTTAGATFGSRKDKSLGVGVDDHPNDPW